MSWDPQYEWYLSQKTPDAREAWHSTKAAISPEEVCSGLPAVYCKFLSSVLSLPPDSTPDYDGYLTELGSIL